jgi:hypothetical protein
MKSQEICPDQINQPKLIVESPRVEATDELAEQRLRPNETVCIRPMQRTILQSAESQGSLGDIQLQDINLSENPSNRSQNSENQESQSMNQTNRTNNIISNLQNKITLKADEAQEYMR